MVSLIAGLKVEGIVKWRGLKLQAPLYINIYLVLVHNHDKSHITCNIHIHIITILIAHFVPYTMYTLG